MLALMGSLVIILLIIVIIRAVNPPIPQKEAPSPSAPPTLINPQKNPYKEGSLEKDYQRITKKEPILETDESVKTKLLKPLGNQSGMIHQTQDYKIEYVKTPDVFMVEILDTDTEAVKEAATGWFKEQGLSDKGVCNLPVVFYLNSSVKEELIKNSQEFNPTPPNC